VVTFFFKVFLFASLHFSFVSSARLLTQLTMLVLQFSGISNVHTFSCRLFIMFWCLGDKAMHHIVILIFVEMFACIVFGMLHFVNIFCVWIVRNVYVYKKSDGMTVRRLKRANPLCVAPCGPGAIPPYPFSIF